MYPAHSREGRLSLVLKSLRSPNFRRILDALREWWNSTPRFASTPLLYVYIYWEIDSYSYLSLTDDMYSSLIEAVKFFTYPNKANTLIIHSYATIQSNQTSVYFV